MAVTESIIDFERKKYDWCSRVQRIMDQVSFFKVKVIGPLH